MSARPANTLSKNPPSTASLPAASPAQPPRPLVVVAIVVGLLGLHWMLGTTALKDKCTTSDEIAHLTAGCAYWKWNDYRLQPENGNLPQRWHALPAVLSGIRLPGPDSPGWQSSDVWEVGRAFFYAQGNDSRKLLAQGRAMAALFSVATCLLVFCWSRRLFGTKAALVSLLLAALCPTMLAHGPLMTSDMCLTFFLLASTWGIWELLFEITPLRLIGAMLAIAGLFLAKMSAPLIFPVAAALVIARLFVKQPLVIRRWALSPPVRELHTAWQQLAAAATLTAVCGLFAFTAVWAAYGFRYRAIAAGSPTEVKFHNLDDLKTACFYAGSPGRVLAALGRGHVLPEAYLFGSAHVLVLRTRPAFLNGEYSFRGWRHFFPYCFLVKTPLALFVLLALAANAVWRCRERPPWRSHPGRAGSKPALAAGEPPSPIKLPLIHLTPLVVLFVIYWATAIPTTLNIGYRHILPIYPVLYILAGAAALLPALGQRRSGLVLAILCGLFAAESLFAWPNYIAYFNPLMPRGRAHEHLVDSNLDWGQDLPGLARWLQAYNAGPQREPVYLCYFGNGWPPYEGIEAIALPPPPNDGLEHPFVPGLYCISATQLVAVNEEASGRWNQQYEKLYQTLRAALAGLASGQTPVRENGQPVSPAEIVALRSTYEYFKYVRLLAYLRHRQPDDHIGHSILIFHLTQDDIDRAVAGPPVELDEKPWKLFQLKHSQQQSAPK